MPELPEVEAARRALHHHCCGRVILKASVAEDPIVIEGVSAPALQTALSGRKILDASRKGKNLWLHLDQRPWPSFQFGMTGAFHIKGKEITKYKRSAVSDKEEWPSKFSKVFMTLDDGLEVSFTDKRRLARVRLLQDPISVPPISELGPDAFLALPAQPTFASSILKRKCPIKALLLDQSFLAGIGNWVADEVLYQARIHPEQVASSLSEDHCLALHKSIQEVIKISVEVDADSERFPENWIFHHRWNKKPGEVGGKKIEFISVGGRTSAYVPALQKCTGESLKKQNGTKRQHRKEPSEPKTTVNKKKGAKRGEKLSGTEMHVSMSAEEGTKKGGRSKKSAGIPEKSEELKETEEIEAKKVGGKKKIEIKEQKVEKGSRKQKADSISSKAKMQDIEDKEQPTSITTEGKKRGRPRAKKEAEHEDKTTHEASITKDEIANLKVPSRKIPPNVKKGLGMSEPVNMSEVSDAMNKTKGRKRKHGKE